MPHEFLPLCLMFTIGLLLHEPAHAHLPGPSGVDISLVVDRDPLRHAGPWGNLGNEGDFAVLDAADPNPLLERHICGSIVTRLVIGDVEGVVLVDEDPARTAEL